ncbi:MAG TPA: hypothetical protein VE987_14375, partial [Polyangiaceae bacterium]|nr:hypothetical protein [Polyangiaceae bacterium]
ITLWSESTSEEPVANLQRPEPRGGAAAQTMNDELRAKTVEIGKLLIESATESSRARYRVGALILDVEADAKKYGRAAVRRVALAVGRDVNTLYEYASVARTWDRKEFFALAARKNSGGVPLSFTHLVLLARIGQKRTRDALLEHAFRDSLTVRELSALVLSKLEGGAAADADDDVPTRLHQIVRVSDGLLERAKGWHSSLMQVARQKSTPELAELLESAANRQRAVAEACTGYADLLDKQHQRVAKDLARAEPKRKSAK